MSICNTENKLEYQAKPKEIKTKYLAKITRCRMTNNEISIDKKNQDFCVITWNNISEDINIDYLLYENRLYVSGNYGEATYIFRDLKRLDFNDFDVDYFKKNFVMSSYTDEEKRNESLFIHCEGLKIVADLL